MPCIVLQARFVQVGIQDSPSVFFKPMSGSRLPISVAHGEGVPFSLSGCSSASCILHGVSALLAVAQQVSE